MAVVESDHIGERMHGRFRPQRAEIQVQIVLELVAEHDGFGIVELAGGRDIGGIDDFGAGPLHLRDRGVNHPVALFAEAEEFVAGHADARAAQSVRVERCGIVQRR